MTPSLILVALSALQTTTTLKPTPPATLVSMGQRRLAQSEIEPARAQYITGPSGGTGCSARVVDELGDYDVARVPPAVYTDPAPLTTIRADLCCVLDRTFQAENWAFASIATFLVTPRLVHFDASFSPTHAPGFEIASADVLLPPLAISLLPFDGLTDFAGLSGATNVEHQAVLGVGHLTVNPGGDAFFRQPFAVYLSSTSSAWTVTENGTGAWVEYERTFQAQGLNLVWNQ